MKKEITCITLWPKRLEYLNHHARVDLRPLVAHPEPARQPRKIREPFYERLALQMQDLCPWLVPPGLPNTPEGEVTYRWMLKCQMSWYVVGPGCLFLTRAPLRLALASHMGLPVFAPGQRCHYTPITTGRRCHQQLGTHSEHVFACAHSPGMRRHNRLRDAWMQLARSAGWHAQTEQLVFIAADVCKRADIVTLALDGTKFACDVMVTASPTLCERHGPHLEKMAAAKARQYNTVSWGRCHEDATFVALVHDAQQHWLHPDALRLLHRLSRGPASVGISPCADHSAKCCSHPACCMPCRMADARCMRLPERGWTDLRGSGWNQKYQRRKTSTRDVKIS